MPRITEQQPGWWRRIGWFVLLYVASFAAVGLVAEGLKAVIPH